MLKKIMSILIILLGITTIAFGFMTANSFDLSFEGTVPKAQSFSVRTASAPVQINSHTVRSAKFGADFYTYIYDASYQIVGALGDISSNTVSAVNQLNEISSALSTVVSAENEIYAVARDNVIAANRLGESMTALHGTIAKSFGLVICAIGALILSLGLFSFGNAFGTKTMPAAPAISGGTEGHISAMQMPVPAVEPVKTEDPAPAAEPEQTVASAPESESARDEEPIAEEEAKQEEPALV